MSISSINKLSSAGMKSIERIKESSIDTKPQQSQEESNKVPFSDFLLQQFNQANTQGLEAEAAIQRSLTGEEVNPHATIIAVQKANVSLTLMMGIKERLERAYQELIRTPLG